MSLNKLLQNAVRSGYVVFINNEAENRLNDAYSFTLFSFAYCRSTQVQNILCFQTHATFYHSQFGITDEGSSHLLKCLVRTVIKYHIRVYTQSSELTELVYTVEPV